MKKDEVKISFICNWGMNPYQLLERYKTQTPNNTGIWENIVGTTDVNNCDIIIVLGSDKWYNINKPTIQIRREPNFIENFIPKKNSLYILDYEDNNFHASTWQFISKDFNTLKNVNFENKLKHISAVTSSKWHHRNHFFNIIENKFPTIDYYGKKYGNLNPQFKDAALDSYNYSIAIENSSQRNYFTEKIGDCYLSLTKPIYWGCPNLSEFFPEDSYHYIDIKNPDSLQDYINRPISKSDKDSLLEAKNLIMYKYNLWAIIADIINNRI